MMKGEFVGIAAYLLLPVVFILQCINVVVVVTKNGKIYLRNFAFYVKRIRGIKTIYIDNSMRVSMFVAPVTVCAWDTYVLKEEEFVEPLNLNEIDDSEGLLKFINKGKTPIKKIEVIR